MKMNFYRYILIDTKLNNQLISADVSPARLTKFNINRRDIDIVDVWFRIYFNSRVRAQIIKSFPNERKKLSNFRTRFINTRVNYIFTL